jgi:hypothetical protein
MYESASGAAAAVHPNDDPAATPARVLRLDPFTTDRRVMADATKLTFPLQVVLTLVAAVLAGTLGVYTVTYGLRSDVRDILTRIELSKQLQDQKMNSMQDAINDMKRRQELQQYELQEFQKTLTRMESRTKHE